VDSELLQPCTGSREPTPSRERFKGLANPSDAALMGFLILCAVVPYLNTLLNGFIHDDNRQVLGNPYLRDFSHLREIFGSNVWSYVGAQGVTNYYRPMMTFGYLILYQLFGPLGFPYHLANILINAGVVCLLFWVSLKIFGSRPLAFFASLLFALHPIHSEAVAWIAAVTDLELAFFFLLTFGFNLAVARPGGRRSDGAQLGMTVSFVLALFSKEPAATLPVLATVYEHFYRADRHETTWPQKVARYIFLWLLAGAYLLFRARSFGEVVPVLQLPQVSWYEAFLSAFALIEQYLWKMVWPAHLNAFYMFHKSTTPLDPRVIAGVAALALCAWLFVFLWSREKAASFGLLWFFATLAPVLNARWLAINVLTERYLYLPSVGLCWIAAWALLRLWERIAGRSRARSVVAGALGITAALCVVRIMTRNGDWRNDVIFYQRTLADSPEAVGFRVNLGAVYWNTGNAQAAEQEWLETLRHGPNAISLNNLGLVRARQKRWKESVDYYQQAIRLLPKYVDPHLNLGALYMEMGRYPEAELQLRAAVAVGPLNPHARNQLGLLYLRESRVAEAREQFLQSLQGGATAEACEALGKIEADAGERPAAIRYFRQALGIDPYDSRAHFGLAAVYAAHADVPQAIQEYQEGLKTDPHNAEALGALRGLQGQPPHAQAPKK